MTGTRHMLTGWMRRLRICRWQDQQDRTAAQQRDAEERTDMRAKGVLKEGMPPTPF